MGGIDRAIQPDANWKARHDLREVAGRIVRREQREHRTGCRREALHMPAEMLAFVGVHRDIGGVPRCDICRLSFLEIRRGPDVIERYDRHEWLSGLYELAELHRFLRHDTAGWRDDARVRQLQRGLIARRARGRDSRIRPDESRLGRSELRLRGRRRRASGVELLRADDLLNRERL